jgi:hypothetical protein
MESCTKETIEAVGLVVEAFTEVELISASVGAFIGVIVYDLCFGFFDWLKRRKVLSNPRNLGGH